jgi:hypothetical protein
MSIDDGFSHIVAGESVKTHFEQRLFGESHSAAENGTFDSYQNIGHGFDCRGPVGEVIS